MMITIINIPNDKDEKYCISILFPYAEYKPHAGCGENISS